MTDLAAAIGLVQLGHLEAWNEARIANACRLTERLRSLELPADGRVTLPEVRPGDRHVFHQYTVQLAEREHVQRHLEGAGVGTAVHYPVPIHHQPVIRELGLGDASLPVAEELAKRVLSLPVHPGLTEDDVERIAREVEAALQM